MTSQQNLSPQLPIPTKLNFANVEPTENDVLVGISPVEASENPGNCILQDVVNRFAAEYNAAQTKQKRPKSNKWKSVNVLCHWRLA